MIVDLQLLCIPGKRVCGKLGRVCKGRIRGFHTRLVAPQGPLSCPPQPALAHVYGIEDPFRELLQLVGGVLGLLLQPQVVLPQVLHLSLKVGFVFFLLGGRAEEKGPGGVATPHLVAALLGRVCGSVWTLRPFPCFLPLSVSTQGLVLRYSITPERVTIGLFSNASNVYFNAFVSKDCLKFWTFVLVAAVLILSKPPKK